MISFPESLRQDEYQLAAFLLGLGLVLFEDKFKCFSQVRDGLLLGLALACGLGQLDAGVSARMVVTRFKFV
jgi:hypothetical protein